VPRASAGLVAGLMAFVLLVAGVGYGLLGSRPGWQAGPADSVAARQAADTGQGQAPSAEQIQAMLQRLQERLKAQPDDADGWAMLGRSLAVLGRHPEAVPAFRRLLALRPQDAQAHADLADAIGMAQGRDLAGEPATLVHKALLLDPRNLKALALGGTVALNAERPAEAIALWQRAKAVAGDSAAMLQTLDGGIAEAQQRLAGASAPSAPSAPGAVSGRVSLAPALAAQAAPEDTVFVFARAAQGPRMPLAILKLQVKDLPRDFTLDDRLAMSPAARLSGAGSVVLGARVSKSGNAMPQPGDLQALSPPVAVGSTGVALVIAEVLK
jgi:cytochrome c-type biogenesis protein CcmH